MFILFIILQLACIIFAFFCLYVIKNKKFNFSVKFFQILLFIVSVLIVSTSLISSIVYIWKDLDINYLILIFIINSIVDIFFIVVITFYSHCIIKNLRKNIIFDKKNQNSIHEIACAFIYWTITEAILGIIIAIIRNINSVGYEYSITISTSFFIYLLLGVTFSIIEILFERSIEIYEENKLTI